MRNNVPDEKTAVKFADGTLVPRKEEVKYLGCNSNQKTDYGKELGNRITHTMVTLKN